MKELYKFKLLGLFLPRLKIKELVDKKQDKSLLY